MASENPYDSPGFVPKPAKSLSPGTLRLDLGAMFRFPFSSANWMMNVLWGSLCFLVAGVIPLVPQLIFIGYQWEILERLHRRETTSYADFDINRMMEYLARSIWPFLASLVGSLIVGLIMLVVLVPLFVLVMVIAGAAESPELAMVMFVVVWVVAIVLSIFANLLIMPLTLRAGLAQDFGKAFDLNWIKAFFFCMWKEMILGALAFIPAALVAIAVAIVTCGLGLYPVAVLLMYATTHFQWQLYEMFLDRGGDPIPLKQSAPPVAAY